MAHDALFHYVWATPTDGLNPWEVARALGGVNSEDFGTLCTHQNINKWAKYKPVKFPTLGATGKQSGSTYWRATDGRCGMAFDVFTSLGTPVTPNTFLYKLRLGQLPWTVDHPTGVIDVCPFRLLDFSYYNAVAENPVGDIATLQPMVTKSGGLTIAFDFRGASDDGLAYSDIKIDNVALTEYYPSVLLYKDSTHYIVASSTSKLSANDFQIILTGMQQVSGVYHCCVFLSDRQIVQGGQFETGKYLSCDIAPIGINILPYTPPYTAEATGIWQSGNTRVNYDVAVRNRSGSTHSFDDLTVSIVRTEESQQPEEGDIVATASIAVFTLAAGGVTTKSGGLNVQREAGKVYWIGASSLHSDIDAEWNQIEEAPEPE